MSYAQNRVIGLSDFTLQMEGDTVQYKAQLPGTVQGTLIDAGVLPHHFVGSNEDSVQWVSDKNWTYTTVFNIDKDELASTRLSELRIDGVDTFSEIYLNGTLVTSTNSFFHTHRLKVTSLLHEGENRLVIRLLSPTQRAHAMYLSNGFMYPADNDRAPIKYSPFVRTAPYHYGWDWGPRLISMGVMRPITLHLLKVHIDDKLYITSEIEWADDHTARRAKVKVRSAGLPSDVLHLIDPNGKVIKGDKEGNFMVESPLLWQPNGWGKQYRYSLVREAKEGDYILRDTTLFGIREIRLDLSKDSIGSAFSFVVNDRPLYAKGANYLPHDRRFCGGGRTLSDVFEQDILPLHFNMIRVWGGGIYETEEFYDLADKHGILIWQDLPFACTAYPNDISFRAIVERELESQFSRLRNHPSLALICGNNEIREGLKHWGWKSSYKYTVAQYDKMLADYDNFFQDFIPTQLREIVPHVQYIHGSPLSSNWGIPESFLSGDSHNWRVWFGGMSFTEFDVNPGRFSSEYGFQAFPEMKTIQSFAPGSDLDTLTIYSPILKNRQRSFIGNQRITDYIERDYPVPSKFSDYIYISQLLQGHGMAYAIRAVRRAYPLNMGSLYWQLNDVWPTVSWSSVDYWGNHKAMHYYVRDAYAPYIVDIISKSGKLELWVASDEMTLPQSPLNVRIEGFTYDGKKLSTEEHAFVAQGAPFSQMITPFETTEDAMHMYYRLTLTDAKGKTLATNIYHPTKPKEMQLHQATPKVTIWATNGTLEVTLSSTTLIKDLFVETPWQGAQYSNNFFDLLPNQPLTITITHPDIRSNTKASELKFTSLNDILRKYR